MVRVRNGSNHFMMDNRYPYLEHVDSIPDRAVVRGAFELSRRVMLNPAWDRRSDSVLMYKHGDPSMSIMSFPFAVLREQAGVDAAVMTICRMRRPWEEKERILNQRESDERYEAQKASEAEDEAIKPDMVSFVEHVADKEKMGKHWRGSAVVQGLGNG